MSDLKRAEHAAMRAAEAPGEADAAYRDDVSRIVGDIDADWRVILERHESPDCGMAEWVAWMCDDPQRLAIMTRVLASIVCYGGGAWPTHAMFERADLYDLHDEFVTQRAREQIASNIEAAAEFRRGGPRW